MFTKLSILLMVLSVCTVRLLLLVAPPVGTVSLIVVAAILVAGALWKRNLSILILGIALPLVLAIADIILISLSVFDRIIISYGLLLALGFSYAQVHKHSHKLPLTKTTAVWLVSAIGMGLFVGGAQYVVLSSGFAHDKVLQTTLVSLTGQVSHPNIPLLLTIPFMAYAEEIVFRHLIYSESRAHLSQLVSTLAANLLYATLFLPASPRTALVAFGSGIFFSFIYIEHKHLVTATLTNMIAKYVFLTAVLYLIPTG